MNSGDDDLSPPYTSSYRDGPYSSSLASSASSSAASVWSDAASQSSDDSSVHSGTSDLELSDSYCYATQQSSYQTEACDVITPTACWPNSILASIVPEQRPHPRRTSKTASRSGCPPPLTRQCDRKVSFVDGLVDSSAQIVEAIWPLSSVICRNEMGAKGVLPLRTFIQETLRRSRTSYSTLQVALYYLILIKPHVPRHDFTMEQPEDGHSTRALQCGRRMFLSALILASKYLQDRNYSARAWSKICGLNTNEINQNEMAFLIAVNWRLHITDAVFQRWSEIVLKFTPNPSPSSGLSRTGSDLSSTWKAIILQLNPELDNIDSVLPPSSTRSCVRNASACFATPVFPRGFECKSRSKEATSIPSNYTPQVLEPSLPTTHSASKLAPAFGLLPTPKLTPQSTGYNTPAVSAASYMLSRPSMGFAMSQVSSVSAAQSTERWEANVSPQGFPCARRSSLANSVSSMSSPESMISDSSSRSSRASSISSASSVSAPFSSKLDVQARCRYAKQISDRNLRMTIAAATENYTDCTTSSPESYAVPVGKDLLDLSLSMPLGRHEREVDDAARALQELHNHPRAEYAPTRTGSKRSRPVSVDQSLQDNVRDILKSQFTDNSWSDMLARPRVSTRSISRELATGTVCSVSHGGDRKRVCCSTEAATELQMPNLLARPGMWEGILN